MTNYFDINYKKHLCSSTLVLCLGMYAFSAQADILSEARTLMAQSNYNNALDMLENAIDTDPKSRLLGTLSQAAGECELALGNPMQALRYFTTARERGVADAYLQAGLLEMKMYHFDTASTDLNKYRELVRKNSKQENPIAALTLESIPRAEDMMAGRVEKITVIDSISMPRDRFFEAYRLSAPAGKLIYEPQTDTMGEDWADFEPKGLSFESEDGTVRYMTTASDNGLTRLYECFKLLNGTWSEPTPLFDEEIDAAYPFMMSDGCTFYFASRNGEGLGGYDIYRSNRDNDTGEFQNPVNMGMPYNSPGNDYMLVIDEYTGAGWWATDRAGEVDESGKPIVTIYVFVPNEIRQNYDADTPGIEQLAALWTLNYSLEDNGGQLPGWKLTQTDNTDYSELLTAIQNVDSTPTTTYTGEFYITGPSGKLYTEYIQLPPETRTAMREYLHSRDELTEAEAKLADMRSHYRNAPSQQMANDIENLQVQIERQRRNTKAARSSLFKILRNADA